MSSDMATPPYLGSSPRSSLIVDTTCVGTRTSPCATATDKSIGMGGTGTSAAGTSLPDATKPSYTDLTAASSPSNDCGTVAPASASAEFFACALSFSPPERAPAWPNCTSLLNSVAHVPLTHATTGLVMAPALSASTTPYSSAPPSSPSTTIILTCGMFWKRRQWSDNVDPGNVSPPMAMPSKSPSVARESTLYISFDMPPLLDTKPTEPGRCSRQAMMFSRVPAVSPILNAPACTPPTVAGPSTTLLFARAYAMSALVSRSGTPSAMMATVRIVGWRSAAMDDSDALRNDA
mmetsp:Transcript_43613/g.130766  ORF Transcript_43613/g.130766 Transcript_43613/m.130766 type:complete len:292 (+) Transcript_43613:1025-1900(+)